MVYWISIFLTKQAQQFIKWSYQAFCVFLQIDDIDNQSGGLPDGREDGIELVPHRAEEGLDGDVDSSGAVVGPRIEHPNVDKEPHRVEAGDVGEDETETVVDGAEQAEHDPVGQPYLLLLLFSLLDGLNATLRTLQDMYAGYSIPKIVVSSLGRMSKMASSKMPKATVRKISDRLKPDFAEMLDTIGISVRSLSTFANSDCKRGLRSLLIFKYRVQWCQQSNIQTRKKKSFPTYCKFGNFQQWKRGEGACREEFENATQQYFRMDQLNEVVKYILYRCRENNTPITEIMANFVAQTVYNPRTEKFYLEDKLSESQMRELKEAAIKRIFAKDSLEMKIIAMQINYDTEFLETELRKQTETQNEAIASGEHTDEVINHEVKNAKDFEGLSQLYKKIYNYLLFKNRAITDRDRLDQNRPKIEKEVAAALESVIPRAALAPFVTLSSSEKLIQLVELSNLVIGIRLFNQEIGKGGSGLLKASQLLNNQAQNVREEVFREVEDVTELCEKYGQILRVFQRGRLELQNSEFRRLRNELTFIRQYKSFLVSLAEEIESSESAFDSNSIKYGKEIDDLKQLLGSKSSAPKEQVYPKFAILAQSYVSIFEERKYFEDKVKLYALLKEFRKSFPLSLSQKFYEKAADIFNGLPQESASDIEEDPNSGIQIFLQSSSPDFMQKDCDYLGFCIWSIVKHNGLLIPGEPGLGVYKYKDKNCVFSTTQAITDFMKEPELYILGILDQCRKNPELIYFLRLEDSFKNVKLSLVNQAVEGGIKNKLMVDKGIETPVHFVEKNIDPNYCWNEWELRKKAIQMANIRKTQTRGDQTLLSNFKVDSDTQTYLKKDAETNTVKNTGTQYKAEKHSIGV